MSFILPDFRDLDAAGFRLVGVGDGDAVAILGLLYFSHLGLVILDGYFLGGVLDLGAVLLGCGDMHSHLPTVALA